MSRYNVMYKPGGVIAKPLEMAIKMQRATPAEAPACIMAPDGPFWVDQVLDGEYDPVNAYAYVMEEGDRTVPWGGLFFAARVQGELCGRDNDIVFDAAWSNLEGAPTDAPGPAVWTNGNALVVTAEVFDGFIGTCSQGILTVTATLDGEPVGPPIALTFTFVPPIGET